ncbi:twin-arginine translocase TatA/TatE family subunit [uncultured Desulfovibrio sp.]|mgnify:CR=1 FL=1|uniref:Sec-independent protein translocase subunit TatA/TatB n=1 Tax=uncultured Desulfovibrio sp. TaxID=167968 RepID=UPI0003A5A187|nr:twin-arginine translocase TatA/TatE family subunit [uncultured Desulfovibrio sp.]
MFGIGSTELLIILVVALVVLGPKSLATISRSLGKAMGEFRRVSTEFQRTLNAEAAQEEDARRKKAAAEAEVAKAAKIDRLECSASGETVAAEPASTQETPVADAAPSTSATRPEATTEAAASPAPSAASASSPTGDGPAISVSTVPSPPADSPLAAALAKTRAEAEAVVQQNGEAAPAAENGGKA